MILATVHIERQVYSILFNVSFVYFPSICRQFFLTHFPAVLRTIRIPSSGRNIYDAIRIEQPIFLCSRCLDSEGFFRVRNVSFLRCGPFERNRFFLSCARKFLETMPRCKMKWESPRKTLHRALTRSALVRVFIARHTLNGLSRHSVYVCE